MLGGILLDGAAVIVLVETVGASRRLLLPRARTIARGSYCQSAWGRAARQDLRDRSSSCRRSTRRSRAGARRRRNNAKKSSSTWISAPIARAVIVAHKPAFNRRRPFTAAAPASARPAAGRLRTMLRPARPRRALRRLLLDQHPDPSVVLAGLDPRNAGGQIDDQTFAAHHVLALGDRDIARQGDGVGSSCRRCRLAGRGLVLLNHGDAALGFEPADRLLAAGPGRCGLHRGGLAVVLCRRSDRTPPWSCSASSCRPAPP